ncbi:dCTP deaminase [Scytonema tolypothrichoides VB-61278]|nr:dCTP deaminase [Scytonema tolypothrichoides VB-61278]
MLKNDRWIIEQAQLGMIEPFEPSLVRAVSIDSTGLLRPVLSYGLSSYGYDIRLSPVEFKVFRHIPGTVVNPKKFNPDNLESVPLHSDEDGDYFIIPAHSYGLGVALERLVIPANITCLFIGKSTYARCGLIWNLTPGESGWTGWLTLEVSNSSSADCRVFANEGVVQALFMEGEPCGTTYADRAGKYQDQPHKVTLAKV